MKKTRKIAIVSAVLSVALVFGIMKYHSSADSGQPDTIWVQANTVKSSALPLEVNAIGTLVARSVEVTPEVAGHVDKILFKDGVYVKQNTPLIQLDNVVAKSRFDSA